MRIAFLAPEYYNAWGGVGIYSIHLTRELARLQDTEVHVFTPDIDDNYKKEKINKFVGNVKIHTMSKAKDSFVYNLKFQLGIAKNQKKLKHFDIIHSANLVHMPDIFLKLLGTKIPSVVTAHTTITGQVSGFLRGNKNPLKMAPSEKWSIALYPIIRFLEWVYMKKTSNMITVSNKFKSILKKDYGFTKKIDVIPNAINLSNYDYDSISIKEALAKFPELKKINKPIIFYAGRLISQKGIDLLIRSLKKLDDSNVGYHCIVAGRGDLKRFYRLIKQNKIAKDNITYLGHIDNKDLAKVYRIADIFALPSYYENFPISLLEAMSMECACIAADSGAVDEIIKHEKDGIIIPQGDFSMLAEKLKILIKDKELRKEFAKKARKKIIANHSAKVMAKKTREVYKRVIS